ncbi:MAG: hypothetical protein H6559_34175 [Lewinellaceae bacterium]|nr:hypothetical protein [Lewinellaceae bacterium]
MLVYLICNGTERILRHKIIEGFWYRQRGGGCPQLPQRRHQQRPALLERSDGTGKLEISCRDNAYFLQAPGTGEHRCKNLPPVVGTRQVAGTRRADGRGAECLPPGCELYSGDFLESVTRNIEWVESTRSKLKEAYLSALDRMAVLLMERALYQEAEDTCRKILDIDDCIEGAHRQLMLVYCHTQQRSKALRQYAWCCQVL